MVALYTSAWIEMNSLPSSNLYHLVALYTSAWIEIAVMSARSSVLLGRTLHECVD